MIAYIITGEEERDGRGRVTIPRDATHVSVHPSVKVIPAELFYQHQNIVELICHDGVEKIEAHAFQDCPRLKRLIILGVKVVEYGVFLGCAALEYVDCPKLERIGYRAFENCKSLRNIDLPSAKVVDGVAFGGCEALMDMKFGKELESFQCWAFCNCPSLQRITIPLKNGLITSDDVFQECVRLKRVDLVEGAILRETTAALLLEDWRNEMNAQTGSINHILPNARAGEYEFEEHIDDAGGKAQVIREWIARVQRKIINYKAKHRNILNEAASALQLALPNDIVTNHVLPFLELPLHTFHGEEEEENMDDSDDGSEYTSEDAGEKEDVSADGGDDEEQQQQDDEGGRKRRKTANDDDTERVD